MATETERLTSGEVSIITDQNGVYRFTDIPSFRDYSVAVMPPSGFNQVAPGQSQGFAWNLFLQPGGDIGGRDFGFVRVSGTGQSTNSSVSGRIFDDKNDNGVYDAGTDLPLANTVVYLDTSQNVGVRDENEPAVETDANGNYTIDNLGSSIVAVSTLLDETTIHASPLGSDFELERFPLFRETSPFGNPQAIATSDFNGDSFPDVAVALSEANKISIRLNDGSGGFLPDEIDIDLGTNGGGPTSLVIGQFNGPGTPLDIALTNNFASNVMILTDFNGTDFNSIVTIPVGEEPLDIAVAEITGDADHLDLVIVNKADNSIQVLLNDGGGDFTAENPIGSGGIAPVSLVTGQLTGDGSIDVAVAHAAPSSDSSPFGDIRVLTGDGAGGFTLTPNRYEVGATPTDLIAANFDNDPDNRLDLAVSNFGTNSISVLTGNPDGTFTVQPATLGTSSGAFDITSGDIDNDGDVDIVASNLLDRNISILRNTTVTPGVTTFEPLEAIGLGQFSIAQRMPLALADFDQDFSGPSNQGTLDIVAIPRLTDTLHLLTNTLIDGAHRVQLTGQNVVTGLNFIVNPASLPPTLDAITNPLSVVEDASPQTIDLTGIAKGRIGGPPLQFVATSSDTSLIPDPAVNFVEGSTTASLTYTPVADANGVATVSVTVTDAGADGSAGTTDDTSVTRQFDVEVTASNDPPTFAFTGGATASTSEVSVLQTSGAQNIDGFVIGIGKGGGADEASQTLSDFSVTSRRKLFHRAAGDQQTGHAHVHAKPRHVGCRSSHGHVIRRRWQGERR